MDYVLKTIRTTVLKCDTPTITDRVYPLDLVKKSIKNDRVLQEKLATHSFFGEVHFDEVKEVDLSKAAFNVDKLYWYKNELRAKIDILDTYYGRALLGFLKGGRFTTYGRGSMDANKRITEFNLCNIYFTSANY